MRTALILASALVFATAAQAQTNMTATKPTTPVTKPKAAMSGTPALKTAPAKATPAKTAATGRMVTATTKSGKKITYDCSKKGNATKAACKA